MPKCKDNAQLTNESSYQEFCFALDGFCQSCLPDSPNAYEKHQIPLKGNINPKIATPSSNQGQNNEKHKFDMPKCKDNAQLTNKSSYQEFCFALGGFCRSCLSDSPNRPRKHQTLMKSFKCH